ncbi:MAG: PVC-type heme-binding CxxCH protein [Planctomycetales bacterium]
MNRASVGVWVLCPPQLLFIPDRNGDDIPDGEPEVVLDGFEGAGIRHNIPNGLRWGPDGWPYGRHGILATSHLGAPGTNPAERVSLNCGLWRYHPTRKVVEVVCRGTTNPWGADWNSKGELFFINTVINHLFHVVPGAYYQRMFGEHDNPYLYELMGHSADHYHWDTAEIWSDIRKTGVTPTTDQAGGGHAHSGFMFYLGNTWPEKYRDTFFTVNFHGKRLNNDAIERAGAGFVGKHRPDHLKTADPWFRGIDLIAANDGGVYLADWSDIGECHDNDGIHRSSGRIFKIDYGPAVKPGVADVSRLSDTELVGLLSHADEWYARQARKTLQERTAAGNPMGQVQAALQNMFDSDPDVVHKLRAMWSLVATNGATTEWLLQQSLHADESVRAWSVRLLSDQPIVAGPVAMRLAEMAEKDPSGLVLTYVASALQRLSLADRWDVGGRLVRRADFANDPKLPLMVWYGIEPGVPEHTVRAVELAELSDMPFVVRAIARRLTESIKQVPGPVDQLVKLAGDFDRGLPDKTNSDRDDRGLAWLAGRPEPKNWKQTQSALNHSQDEEIRRRVRDLSVVFGDGRSLKEVLAIASEGKAGIWPDGGMRSACWWKPGRRTRSIAQGAAE